MKDQSLHFRVTQKYKDKVISEADENYMTLQGLFEKAFSETYGIKK